MTIIAATDGSALGNPGPAGWAWYVDDDCWAAGGWAHGTNNMGELTAVLDLLQQTAHVDDDLLVYCDSRYAIDSITKWMPGWKRNGWVKKDRKPVLNVEIMKALDTAMQGRRVKFEWVKGHSGHALNEAADVRANAAAAAYQAGSLPDTGPGFSGGVRNHPDARVGQTVVEPDLFSTAETMEPDPVTTVVALEKSLLTDAVRSDPAAVAALLDPHWREIGASGRVWSREEMLAEVGPIGEVGFDLIATRTLADDTVLVLWRSEEPEGTRARSSIWQRDRSGHWQQVFHQGTPER